MCKKLNCWEYKNCGREAGGLMADALGECPVSRAMKFDGLNGGKAAGRACWMVPNSACRLNRGRQRIPACHNCEFYKRVVREEADQVSFKYHTQTA
ncbi:MAG: hypothetical protein P1R58_06190 [bacterium]|nr:hypothetical protein [bacterium]